MSRDANNNERNNDRDYPGYPHYPSSEDITQPQNNNGKVPANQEQADLLNNGRDTLDNDTEIVMGTEADVTAEDLQVLNSMEEPTDNERANRGAGLDDRDNDGELLNERTGDAASTGEDLDVPGSEADDANELIGEEDEENNYYSLGRNDDDANDDTAGIP